MTSNDPALPGGDLPTLYPPDVPLAVPVDPPPAPLPSGFPLQPGFWAAILWCVGMLLLTQVPGGVVSIALMLVLLFALPGQPDVTQISDPGELLGSTAGQMAVGAGLGVAHLLMIGLSLVVLRIVVGQDWRREVAVRRPTWSQALLVAASAPAFVVVANVTYRYVQNGLQFPGVNDLPAAACFLTSVVGTVAAAGVVSFVLWLVLGRHWGRRLSGNGAPVRSTLLTAAALAGVVGCGVTLYRFALPTFRDLLPAGAAMANMEEMEGLFSGWPVAVAVLFVAVLPALSEELWCRAFVGRGLIGLHGLFWGVLLTSFLFGVIHVDPCQGTMAMVLGVFLHVVYLLTRSLWMPMLLHFLNNAMAVTLPRLPAVQELETIDPRYGAVILAAACVVLAVVGVALVRCRARLVTPAGEPEWTPPHRGVVCPPAGSATQVVSPALTLPMAALVLIALAGLAGAVALPLMR
ncbi:MAG: type II CAAX endopeptidase family protein [Gemmataceae bacterium]